jgi:hypothetical protein
MRASSMFVFNFVIGLVGIGFGPTLVGFISDRFARSAFTVGDYALCPKGRPPTGVLDAFMQSCAGAQATGLRHALMLMSLTCVWAAVHYWLAARTLRGDLATLYVPPAAATGSPTPAAEM